MKLLIIRSGDGKHILAIGARKTHFTFISFIGLTNCITVTALKEYYIRDCTIMTTICCTWHTCVDLFLYQVSLAFASDSKLRLVWLWLMDSVDACHCVRVHYDIYLNLYI